jgi:Homeodomain-like domain
MTQQVVQDSAGDDPATGLSAVRSLRELADRLEVLQVTRARELGWSWQDVADALGVSRQAVHKKHGRRK